MQVVLPVQGSNSQRLGGIQPVSVATWVMLGMRSVVVKNEVRLELITSLRRQPRRNGAFGVTPESWERYVSGEGKREEGREKNYVACSRN